MDVLSSIEALIKERGWNGSEFSRRLGMSRSTFSNWKEGKSDSYKTMLYKIAEILGTTETYLRGETNDPAPTERDEAEVNRQYEDALRRLGAYNADGSIDEERINMAAVLLENYEKIVRELSEKG